MLVGRISPLSAVLAAIVPFAATIAADGQAQPSTPDVPVSYYEQILPIFQAHCQGCHQPAKASGEYVISSFDTLLKGGESGEKAIVPGKPDESYLIEQITPEDGEALMPPDKPPLAASDIALIRRWIEQGAKDDTPENARWRYDMEHPPVYTRPPVISSLDFSPDGAQLAVAGFHEVLLVKADGSERISRLVGVAERVESVRFSPDGRKLAAAGGLPCRMGEIQVWDVAKRKLLLSQPMTFDTVYGGNWSPDGKLIAFGAADNGVRAIDAETGEQVAYMAAHDDWVRGTVFSADGKSIFSASRDMTVKMTDVETQRFVGNVTTHTPGVLKGGQQAIDRHPKRAEILVGGADGAAKLFKMDVQAAPAGGGNPNQIREYEALPGRVFDVRFSPDAARAFAGSSLDGQGQVRSYETDSGKVQWTLDVPESAIYALACSPDGATLAAAGSDGRIRLIDVATGQLRKSFLPVDITASTESGAGWVPGADLAPQLATPSASAPAAAVAKLESEPTSIRIAKPTDYVQVLLTATLADGARMDATRLATLESRRRRGARFDRRPLHACQGRRRQGRGGVRRAAQGNPRRSHGFGRQLRTRLCSRRESRAVADGLQSRHLPRGRQRQERLQAVAPRLRPALRPPGADRRPRVAALQPASPDESLMLLKPRASCRIRAAC